MRARQGGDAERRVGARGVRPGRGRGPVSFPEIGAALGCAVPVPEPGAVPPPTIVAVSLLALASAIAA